VGKNITIEIFPILTLEVFLEKMEFCHFHVCDGLIITMKNPMGQKWVLPLVRAFFQKMKKS
jgi:hypothetical protein